MPVPAVPVKGTAGIRAKKKPLSLDLALASGHGHHLTVTPERAPLPVRCIWSLSLYPFQFRNFYIIAAIGTPMELPAVAVTGT
jgi:hypothetical protein